MLALLAQATEDYTIPDVATTVDVDTGAAAGIFAVFGTFMLVFLLIGLVLFAFNVWMIIDCATRKDADFPNNNKSMWLILMIVGLFLSIGWIPGLIYFFTIRKKAKNGGSGAAPTPPPAETPQQ